MADFKHFRSFTVLHTKVSTKKSNKMKMKNWIKGIALWCHLRSLE